MTEYQAQVKRCSCCGKETRAEFPKEANQAVQYGTEAKSQMTYLNHEQHIPLKRTRDVFEEFYGHRPAEGTIYAAGAEAAQIIKPATDERFAVLAGTLSAKVDCPLIVLLLKIKKKVETVQRDNQTELSERQKASYFTQYDKLIQQGLRANPRPNATNRKPGQRGRLKQSPARNLVMRLKEHRAAVLAFMLDFKVPFDTCTCVRCKCNNQSERDLRMMKVKQKVSGCFRSEEGAAIFCQICGYLSTARKNGQMALSVLRLAFIGTPYLPSFVSPLAV